MVQTGQRVAYNRVPTIEAYNICIRINQGRQMNREGALFLFASPDHLWRKSQSRAVNKDKRQETNGKRQTTRKQIITATDVSFAVQRGCRIGSCVPFYFSQ